MKKLTRHEIVCIAIVLGAFGVQYMASRFVGARDVLAGVVVRHELLPLATLGALFVARLFLFSLAPGWILFLVLKRVVERGRLRPP